MYNNIIPLRKLSTETSKIAEICRHTGEPLFITRHGHGNIVLMSMEAYQKLAAAAEANRKPTEVEEMVKNLILDFDD